MPDPRGPDPPRIPGAPIPAGTHPDPGPHGVEPSRRVAAKAAADDLLAQALAYLRTGDRAGLLGTWRRLDAHIVAAGAAAWGERLLGRLLVDDPALGIPDTGAWGALTTTYAECVHRQRRPGATTPLWGRAWEWAQALESAEERASVLVRIASGGVARAAADHDGAAFDTWMLRLHNLLSERAVAITAPAQAAPVIAALMTCADALDAGGVLAPAPPLVERVASFASEVRHAPERALSLACIARLAARRQDADLARKRFTDALQTLSEASDREPVACLHWPASLDATSWVVLEAIRGLAGLEPVEETLARFDALPAVSRPITQNRLASLRLRLTAAARVPAAPVAAWTWAAPPGTADVDPPTQLAHVAVPPWTVAHALTLMESGRPAQALRLLADFAPAAARPGRPELAAAVERARADVVTRLRLDEIASPGMPRADRLRALSLAERERARAFLTEDGPDTTDADDRRTRAERHAIWRTRRAFDEPARLALARWGVRTLASDPDASGEDEWVTASVALDLVECSDLGADAAMASHGVFPVSPEDWWARHPASPEQALRLWIRSAALGVSPEGPTATLVRCVGVRRAAAIAMEEGELLALRLPGQALRLLAFALTWYDDAHDAFGAWQATTLLTLARVRAGVPREHVDLGVLRTAHDAFVSSHADWRGADAVPSWSALESAPLPLGSAHVMAVWVPWLHRVVALQRWIAGGVRPEVLLHDRLPLPVELRAWPHDVGSAAVDGDTARAPAAPAPPRSGAPDRAAVVLLSLVLVVATAGTVVLGARPMVVVLLATALIGLALAWRRRRRQVVAAATAPRVPGSPRR